VLCRKAWSLKVFLFTIPESTHICEYQQIQKYLRMIITVEAKEGLKKKQGLKLS
jgi:hypothetical protein